MILVSSADGAGPVELLQEDETAHLVGESKAGERAEQVCLLPHPLIQAEMTANEETDRLEALLLPAIKERGQLFGTELAA